MFSSFFKTADFETDARRGEGRAAELTLVVNEQRGRASNAAAGQRMRFCKSRRPASEVVDIPIHSQGIWLAEIATRSRVEGEPPTKAQVRDLIDGVRWLITNVF